MNKNSNIIVFQALLLFLFWSCTSCNGNNPENDTENDIDMTRPDKDSDDLSDEALAESEDAESDETDDEVEYADVDYQGAEECPELKVAKFPYYNDDLSIHFCRKCDKPTVKDPQCVENLWKDAAAALYAVAPEAECENGYPCDMPQLKPRTQAEWDEDVKAYPALPYRPHECDMVLSPRGWATDSTAGAIKHFDISDGKVGLFLNNVVLDYKKYRTYAKTMEYDPETRKYRALSPIVQEAGSYNKGCMLHLVNNFHFYETVNNTTRYLAHSCSDGTRRVVYPGTIRFVSYTPALSEKWAIANIEVKDGEGSSAMYAKVGTWKWTKLMEGLAYFPEIVNDKAIFYTDSFKGYYCDLSKNPKSVDDCMLVNENESEEIRYPLINEDDETEILYESDMSGVFSIKRLKIGTEGKKEYSKLITTHESTDEVWKGSGYAIQRVTQETVFYNELLYEENGGTRDGNSCFYNRKTKKTVCMKKVQGMEKYYFGYGEWEGKWMVYQFRAVALQAIRDLDCYCEKEGVCPFGE
ncbi:MAG TPA: hypothetical protein PLD55_07875 [bacterium]|nr:hypothetical protein [bacterium]HQM84583.1 hypothetical protein [bacterium]